MYRRQSKIPAGSCLYLMVEITGPRDTGYQKIVLWCKAPFDVSGSTQVGAWFESSQNNDGCGALENNRSHRVYGSQEETH